MMNSTGRLLRRYFPNPKFAAHLSWMLPSAALFVLMFAGKVPLRGAGGMVIGLVLVAVVLLACAGGLVMSVSALVRRPERRRGGVVTAALIGMVVCMGVLTAVSLEALGQWRRAQQMASTVWTPYSDPALGFRVETQGLQTAKMGMTRQGTVHIIQGISSGGAESMDVWAMTHATQQPNELDALMQQAADRATGPNLTSTKREVIEGDVPQIVIQAEQSAQGIRLRIHARVMRQDSTIVTLRYVAADDAWSDADRQRFFDSFAWTQ